MSNNQPIPTTTIVPERQQKPGTSISDLGSEGAGRDEKGVRVGTERENKPTEALEGQNQAMAERQGNHLSCTDPTCHCHPWVCGRQEQVHKSGDEVRYHGRVFQFSHYLYDKPDADMAIIYRGNDRILVKVGDLKPRPMPTGHDERCVPACPCRQWVAATPLDDEANAALHHALDLIGVEAVRGRIAPTNDDEAICVAIDSVLSEPDLATRLEEGERLRKVERSCDCWQWGGDNKHSPECVVRQIQARSTIVNGQHDPPCPNCGGGREFCQCPSWAKEQSIEDANAAHIQTSGDCNLQRHADCEWLACGCNCHQRDLLIRYDTIADSIGGELRSSKVANLERWVVARRDDDNATLNLLRDIEQRIQLAHREPDREAQRLLLVAIKGIVNRAIYERERG